MSKIPILLLKTRSTPSDAYDELLGSSSLADGPLAPEFIPVLHHQFDTNGIAKLTSLLKSDGISSKENAQFGGMIFTSQRAVEAFAHVVNETRPDPTTQWPNLSVPIYSVGPATTRALSAVSDLNIFGSHTGYGEALAQYIIEHYGQWYKDRASKPPLLFLVGEQRRDIIPRTLMDPSLPPESQIPVTEEVVYGTGVMESFPEDFSKSLQASGSQRRWVVVFSPTGCDSMLKGLGMLDEATGRVVPGKRDGKTFIATIGPTTRDFLVNKFGFEPDVCAKTPSPGGILEGIQAFENTPSTV